MFSLLSFLLPSHGIGFCSTRLEGRDFLQKKSDFVCLITPQPNTQESSRRH